MTEVAPSPAGGPVDLPLHGVRVIELGRFAAGPACATLLADWGADVVKVEPPSGDPARGPGSVADAAVGHPANPRFDVHNRTRRGLALDLSLAAGRAAFHRILDQADVFITNLSPAALEHLAIVPADLHEQHPRLIVAQISGYDLATPAARNRSYDHGAYWAYSGAASLFASPDGEPPQPAGGFGDRAAGSILAGAIGAALYRRERTGRGSYVTTSLVNTGLWLMASDVSDILATGHSGRKADRRSAGIPTLNCFRTADGHWLWLQLMVPENQWNALLRALDAEWLDDDPRFSGGDSAKLQAARIPLIEVLDEIFRGRPLPEWEKRLTEQGITWAPVRSLEEAVTDPAIRASSAFVEISSGDSTHLSINTPCAFAGLASRRATRAPWVGEHTSDVLAAFGYTPPQIEALRAAGAIGPQ
jgi:crotonobetainyl-CoA:carnitine CoA-transferase CaiB-like acyl-CoA transferase